MKLLFRYCPTLYYNKRQRINKLIQKGIAMLKEKYLVRVIVYSELIQLNHIKLISYVCYNSSEFAAYKYNTSVDINRAAVCSTLDNARLILRGFNRQCDHMGTVSSRYSAEVICKLEFE